MTDQWLSLAEAAKRVKRGGSTLRRWAAAGELRVFEGGRVLESHVLALDERKRSRRGGRPKGTTVPLVLEGQQVGRITIGPDGEITGRIER